MLLQPNKSDRPEQVIAEDRRVLHLSTELVINKGRERICYLHPEDSTLVIKIPVTTPGRKAGANYNEMMGYRLLQKEGVDLSFISHCHGFVATDQGRGLVCDCIRDEDGAISKTIWDAVVFGEDCDIDYVAEVARKLCDHLISNRIWLFDLNLKNIVLQERADGTCKPYIIDLKGRYVSYELVPFSKYIPYFSLKKLERRSEQLLQRIGEYHRRRNELRMVDG